MLFGKFKEIKGVVVFDGQYGLGLDVVRHGPVKVGLAEQVSFVTLVVDLMLQQGFGPAEAGGRAQVELARQVVLAAAEDDEILGPADFCNQRLQFCVGGITPIEIKQVPPACD